MHKMKIRYKITLLFALQVSSIIFLLGLSVYFFSAIQRKKLFERRLKSRANYSAQLFSLLGNNSNDILNQIDLTSTEGLLPNRDIDIFSTDGKILYEFKKQGTSKLAINKKLFDEVNADSEKYFRIGDREAIAFKCSGNTKNFIVVVAAYDDDGLQRLHELANILFISLFIGMLLSAVVGFVFSQQLIKPIQQIINEVNEISSYNLSHRIKAGNSKDELNQLANTFNELLERVQKSFNTQSRFISNASHELSTPLTSISSQLEVTLEKKRNADEYEKVLSSIKEDVFQMCQLTKSLLEIAKADVEGNIELSEVRIDEILLKIISEIRKIDSKYLVDLYFADKMDDENNFIVFGNAELLHSAIKNIIENGCKYSTDKLSRVSLSYEDAQVIIRVMNAGNVIAAEELQKIFQPFYRADNSHNYKGFGLGLALATNITRLHKGTIEVSSDLSDGTIFAITVPTIKMYQANRI